MCFEEWKGSFDLLLFRINKEERKKNIGAGVLQQKSFFFILTLRLIDWLIDHLSAIQVGECVFVYEVSMLSSFFSSLSSLFCPYVCMCVW